MCTLTYLLHDDGYELFFNRDEQRSRQLAVPPQFNEQTNAIYPIDPQGEGTWLAVNHKGLSLALLNYYQASITKKGKAGSNNAVSRGQLILSLLNKPENIIEQLKSMDLTVYQPFQLCIFPDNLSTKNKNIDGVKWDGHQLISFEFNQPMTSSSVDFISVEKDRKEKFDEMIDLEQSEPLQYKAYHLSKSSLGKYSVNMSRDDAKTVSISHISIRDKIIFNYYDNVCLKSYSISLEKNKSSF